MGLWHRAFNHLTLVDHRARHGINAILRCQLRKFGGLNAVGANVLVLQGEAVSQAYRPRAVWSSWGDEDLQVDGLDYLAELLFGLGAEL
jgi:hypothetical protein